MGLYISVSVRPYLFSGGRFTLVVGVVLWELTSTGWLRHSARFIPRRPRCPGIRVRRTYKNIVPLFSSIHTDNHEQDLSTVSHKYNYSTITTTSFYHIIDQNGLKSSSKVVLQKRWNIVPYHIHPLWCYNNKQLALL